MPILRKKRGRSTRVASLELPPGRVARMLLRLRSGEALLRLGLCLLAAVAIWVINVSWVPPFAFREGYIPTRDITANVPFERPDPNATERLRELARNQAPYVYRQDSEELVLLRAALDHALGEVVTASSFAELGADTWRQFAPGPVDKQNPPNLEQQEEQFEQFRASLGGNDGLDKLKGTLDKVFEPLAREGLLERLPEEHGEGNRKEIAVYPAGHPEQQYLVQVNQVLIGDAARVRTLLEEHVSTKAVAGRLFSWLQPRLRPTLHFDKQQSDLRRERAVEAVPQQYSPYEVGKVLAPRGKPLTADAIQVLRLEYDRHKSTLPLSRQLQRGLVVFCMILALFVLCGYYIYSRQRQLLDSFSQLFTLLLMAVATVAVVGWTSADPWRAELIPLLLFGMTFGIAYGRDVALLLSVSLTVIVSIAAGDGLGAFIVFTGTVSTAILQLVRIRTRSKLISVGFFSALAALLLSLGVALLAEQPLGYAVLVHGGRNALWAFLAGFLITGMLPFIEKAFGVLTEISLLELGDVSHPLLQELVRRAPGTYNHSINVASIGEAAAESIGAQGLLVRVGAYFHDIGKMLKPDYFVENQGSKDNRHDSLMPAMSTLIIIAHIKDGADLARQHHLPDPIIDFIEQHHGTMLVEYFYRRAAEQQSETDPQGGDVPESSYRYPGPKPQSVEAAVLMLADAVESACRALVEPTPARIESLVEEISMKRLLDGQFDDCRLTLKQLQTIEDSLVKSLDAVYHGRLKYPDQQTA